MFSQVCNAQSSNSPISVVITVVIENQNESTKKERPLVPAGSRLVVYAFKTQRQAFDFYNYYKDQYQRSLASGVSAVSEKILPYEKKELTDNNGEVQMLVLPHWYIVVANPYEGIFSKNGPTPVNGRSQFTLEVKSEDTALSNVDVKSNFKFDTPVDSSYDCGDQRIFDIKWPLLSKETNTTYRYGMAPYCMEVSGEEHGFTSEYQKYGPNVGKVFKKLQPRLIDGEKYKQTQKRKMGYDATHDPLYRYVQGVSMQSHDTTGVGFHIVGEVSDLKPNTLYPVFATKWCENYGSLLMTDTLMVQDGYRNDQTKFLDFDFPEVSISRWFERKPREEKEEGNAELKIEFVKGKAEVLSTDTVGLQRLSEIIETLSKIKNGSDDAVLYSVSVHGYASPEGGRAANERLCVQRAAYLKQQILSIIGSTEIDVKGSVAHWQEVADSLRNDSLFDSENLNRAAQIEGIIASSKDDAMVEARLRSLPLYRFLSENEDRYFKPLRKVRISYSYSQTRLLSKDEVVDRYKKTKSVTFPYQYQIIFDYLKDKPEELGRMAHKAMQEVTERTGKPWTLAAYYLAKSYTARAMCDTTLLTPYLTTTGEECMKDYPGSFFSKRNGSLIPLNTFHLLNGDTLQLMNDAGIVVQQISMLVQSNKISKALNLANRILSPMKDSVYQRPIMMLECKCKKKYNDKTYRDMVAATSDWNKVVVFAAQDANPRTDKASWAIAWATLNDTTKFKFQSARELYMKSVLAHRLYRSAANWNNRTDKTPVPESFFNTTNFSVFDVPPFDDTNSPYPWGACMIKACEMEPSFINILKFDAEFNQNFRDGFAKYWNRIHPDKIIR